jgi:hypothetical protein
MIEKHDFSRRLLWTSFSPKGNGYAAFARGVDGAYGMTVMAATAVKSGMFTTNGHSDASTTIHSDTPDGYMCSIPGEAPWAGVFLEVDTPASGTQYDLGDAVSLSASATGENSASVSSIAFVVDNDTVATAAAAGTTVQWTPATDGYHRIYAVTEVNGVSTRSQAVQILVRDDPVATAVQVEPEQITMVHGSEYQFSATVLDQYTTQITETSLTWEASTGTVTDNGLYTAPAQDTLAVITVTVPGTQLTSDATVQVTEHIHWQARVNFGTALTSSMEEWKADGGLVYGDRGDGYTYGWLTDNTEYARNRSEDDHPLWGTLNHLDYDGGHFTWEIAVPDGEYMVSIGCGDPRNYGQSHTILAEGEVVVSGTEVQDDNYLTNRLEDSTTVTVSDGRLSVQSGMDLDGNSGKICWITIRGTEPLPIQNDQQSAVTTRDNGMYLRGSGIKVFRVSDGCYTIRGNQTHHLRAALFGLDGRVVRQWTAPPAKNLQIRLRGLARGRYVLRIINERGRVCIPLLHF